MNIIIFQNNLLTFNDFCNKHYSNEENTATYFFLKNLLLDIRCKTILRRNSWYEFQSSNFRKIVKNAF